MSAYPNAHVQAFRLVRGEDVSGVSGTGVVALGTETVVCTAWDMHPTTRVVLVWLNSGAMGIYDSVQQMEDIHGHGGATRVEWLSPGHKVVQL